MALLYHFIYFTGFGILWILSAIQILNFYKQRKDEKTLMSIIIDELRLLKKELEKLKHK